MDLLKVFESISIQLLAEFQKSSQVKHHGGKGNIREDAFRDFLKEYLPRKYGIGKGEIISPENRVSGELDVVIFDSDHCPLLIKSSSHSVYPVESVYGAISMKSHLDTEELKDAYQNITSFKKIISKNGFSYSPHSVIEVGMEAPIPVTAIVAYGANRSLEAIAKQVKKLDSELDNIFLRPDFIVVVGLGIIGPREKLRNNFNKYSIPEDEQKRCELRKTGRHTLMRLYMQLLDELNSIQLKPLNLQAYFDMPRIVGDYRVRRHDIFMFTPKKGGETIVKKISPSAIEKIVKNSKKVTMEQHFINAYGQVPFRAEDAGYNLTSIVYEYNPLNKPPLGVIFSGNKNDRPAFNESTFYPFSIEINGWQYAVDLASLAEDDFIQNQDVTVDELMSI
jgi:hypothetical protein